MINEMNDVEFKLGDKVAKTISHSFAALTRETYIVLATRT